MWYKTKEGLEVFNVKHNDHFYQLTNNDPNVGDYCLVSLEHDPTHLLRVKNFDQNKTYQLNNDCRYGGQPIMRNGRIDFYGVCKIVWSDNPDLELNYQSARREMFDYWSKKQPHLTLEDF